MMKRIALSAAFGLLLAAAAQAQTQPGTVRIGVLNDMSGVYADDQGPGSLLAAQMAAEDYGGTVAGRKIEGLSGDHQNKVDIGAAIARGWTENEGVGMIADVTNSAVALAVSDIARERNKVMIASGAGTALLT